MFIALEKHEFRFVLLSSSQSVSALIFDDFGHRFRLPSWIAWVLFSHSFGIKCLHWFWNQKKVPKIHPTGNQCSTKRLTFLNTEVYVLQWGLIWKSPWLIVADFRIRLNF